jgi:hypothetical protein
LNASMHSLIENFCAGSCTIPSVFHFLGLIFRFFVILFLAPPVGFLPLTSSRSSRTVLQAL